MKKKVLIICFNRLHTDPRILRQISWLKNTYEITTLGYSPSGVEGVSHVDYAPPSGSRLSIKLKRSAQYFSRDFESFYWNDALKNLSAFCFLFCELKSIQLKTHLIFNVKYLYVSRWAELHLTILV